MKFNTAIFYDIENLIGGYGLSNVEMLTSLSLKQIVKEIKQLDVGKISIQRAYADWSAPRLHTIKSDMVELGIEPIQMFGFGRGSRQNASDIQLAIDAIDIAFTKPAIEVFVIVSGDGGFSSLANKLHEYGKTVVGCGYRKSVNKVFEAVSDEFIWLPGPKTDTELSVCNSSQQNQGSESFVMSFARKYKSINNPTQENVICASHEIVDFISTNPDALNHLNNEGLNVSVVNDLLRLRIEGFHYKDYGFSKFSDFIKPVLTDTQLTIVERQPNDNRLVLKSNHTLLDLDASQTAEVDNYRKLLFNSIPSFRQFDRELILGISNYLSENKMDYQDVLPKYIMDSLSNKLNYDMLEIVKTTTSLISGGCFILNSDTRNLAKQKMSFVPQTSKQTFMLLESAMRNKLESIIGEVDNDIFKNIFI